MKLVSQKRLNKMKRHSSSMKSEMITGVVFILLVSFSIGVQAHTGDDYYGHHSMMGGFYGMPWMFSLNGLLFTAILTLIIILLIVLIRNQLKEQATYQSRKR